MSHAIKETTGSTRVEPAAEPGVDTSVGQVLVSKVPRRALWMLASMTLLGILSQFFRSSNGVIAPNLMEDLSLNAEEIGVVSGSFFYIFTILQIPIGVLLDRYGGRFVISSMMILAMAGSLVFAVAGSLFGLTAGRLLIGIGCAGIMVGSLVICRRWFPPERYTSAMAVLFAFSNAGSLAAAGPLAFAAAAWGWRGAFVGLAGVAALLTLLFYLVVRDAPPGHPYHRRTPDTLAATIKGLREVWALRDVAYILPMVAVGYASVITVLGLWGGPYFYEVHGLGEVERGNLLSLMAIAMIAGTLFYGPLDRRFNTRRGVVTWGALATAAMLVVLVLIPKPSLWLASVLLSLFCFLGAYSLVVMAHGLSLFPERLAGRGVTTLNVGLMGGAAVLQTLTGQLIGWFPDRHGDAGDLAYRLLFLLLAALTLAALVLYRRVRDVRPVRVVPSRSGTGSQARTGAASQAD
ncbi:MAG: MFS transporter [Kiloniellaceae bacterium]